MVVVKETLDEDTIIICNECGKRVEGGEDVLYIEISNHSTEICEECAGELKNKIHDNLF